MMWSLICLAAVAAISFPLWTTIVWAGRPLAFFAVCAIRLLLMSRGSLFQELVLDGDLLHVVLRLLGGDQGAELADEGAPEAPLAVLVVDSLQDHRVLPGLAVLPPLEHEAVVRAGDVALAAVRALVDLEQGDHPGAAGGEVLEPHVPHRVDRPADGGVLVPQLRLLAPERSGGVLPVRRELLELHLVVAAPEGLEVPLHQGGVLPPELFVDGALDRLPLVEARGLHDGSHH